MSEDATLTHGCLNALNAGYQGAFVARMVFDKSKTPAPEWMRPMAELTGAMDELRPHVAAMFEGRYVLQRGADLTPDGEKVLSWAKALIQDLAAMAAAVEGALPRILACERPAVILGAAALARQAYTFQHYVRGETVFNERMGREGEADRWRQRQPVGQQQVIQAHQFAEPLMGGGPTDPAFCKALWCFTAGLPGTFRSQIADSRSVEAYRIGEQSFAAMGIPDDRAGAWQAAGWEPYAAAEWEAYRFAPPEACEWGKAGFTASHAGAWRSRGFELAKAKELTSKGLSPIAASHESA